MSEPKPERLCNMCGLTCKLAEPEPHPCDGNYGLIDATVKGGYISTPGNGLGALDDTTFYRFSLCEFCLDWLFGQFKLPVSQGEYMIWEGTPMGDDQVWKPAAQRVAEDDWRSMKKEFQAEYDRRAAARSKR